MNTETLVQCNPCGFRGWVPTVALACKRCGGQVRTISGRKRATITRDLKPFRKKPKKQRQPAIHSPAPQQRKWVPYREYLQSGWWKSKRAQRIKKARGRCERCDKRGRLQVHHLNYERLWCEKDTDLEALCCACHEKEHEIDIQAREHLKAIAGF